MAHTIIKELELPESFQLHAINYATYILNRVPIHAIEKDIIPYQAYTDNKLSVAYFQVFGCTAYALIPKNKRSKFGSKSLQCIHLGYSSRKKAYILFYHPSGQPFEFQDICFDEGSEVEDTRVVIDPSSSDCPIQEDENPVSKIKDKEGEKGNRGNNSKTVDSTDSGQIVTDNHDMDVSKESKYATADKPNDLQSHCFHPFTSSQSTGSST